MIPFKRAKYDVRSCDRHQLGKKSLKKLSGIKTLLLKERNKRIRYPHKIYIHIYRNIFSKSIYRNMCVCISE